MERTNSTDPGSKIIRDEPGKACHLLIDYSGPSFSDLPNEILVNVLLRLRIKRIFVCKAVCKRWNNQISDLEFAKLHFEQSQVYPLLRSSDLPRTVHLVQPEKEDFDLKLAMCDHLRSNSECVCHVKVELDTKFELPLCNLHLLHDNKDGSDNIHDPDTDAEGNKWIKFNMKDHRYRIVNSCNGLLCLADPSDRDPHIVCNPITGEFIKLAETTKVEHPVLNYGSPYIHGFGFSPATNQYKVIRIRECVIRYCNGFMRGVLAEVHSLGTKVWRSIDSFSTYTCEKIPPIYLNGFLYWLSYLQRQLAIISFDIERECFQTIATPPLRNTSEESCNNNVGMGLLGGELCMTGIDEERLWTVGIHVWVMKDYGAIKEWSKVFSIELNSHLVGFGPFHPIKYLNDGALLMFQPCRHGLVYKDPKKLGFSCLEARGMDPLRFFLNWKSTVEVFPHIPSFVPLRHALSLAGQNENVLNVKSSKFVLCNELEAAFLELEEHEEPESSWDAESNYEDRDRDLDSENMILESNSKALDEREELESDYEDRDLDFVSENVVLESNSIALEEHEELESDYEDRDLDFDSENVVLESNSKELEEHEELESDYEDRDLDFDSENVVLECNSKDRCAELELHNEGKAISIEEKEVEAESSESEDRDLECDCDSEDKVLESDAENRKMLMIGMKLTAMELS